MTIVGFSFTKLHAEKQKAQGALKVTNNITLKGVEDAKVDFAGAKQMSLHFDFAFTSTYDMEGKSGVASLSFEGFVVYLAKQDEGKKILDEWKKTKKVDTKILERILNHALDKCNIEAIILSKEIGLPAPVKLPRITAKQ